MYRVVGVLCLLASFVLIPATGTNSHRVFASHKIVPVVPALVSSNSYPSPDNPNLDIISGNGEMVGEMPYPYPMPETNVVPIITFAPSYQNYSYLPLIFNYSIVYNRIAAVAWADQWAHDRHPCLPNYGTGSTCNDCTNYLSQVLYAGGLPILVNPAWDVSAWWYWCDEFCVCTNSNTWSATDWMNAHVSQLQGIRYDYKTSAYDLNSGDFMILDLFSSPVHGIPNHARVFVGWGYPQEGDMLGSYLMLANQHCTDRYRIRWDYNLSGSDLRWFWHVIDMPGR